MCLIIINSCGMCVPLVMENGGGKCRTTLNSGALPLWLEKTRWYLCCVLISLFAIFELLTSENGKLKISVKSHVSILVHCKPVNIFTLCVTYRHTFQLNPYLRFTSFLLSSPSGLSQIFISASFLWRYTVRFLWAGC